MKCFPAIWLLIPALTTGLAAGAQSGNSDIRQGNKLYQEQKFDASQAAYQKALTEDPANAVASYNLGNAAFRNGLWEQAVAAYDNTIANSKDKALTEKAWYNKGVSYTKAKELEKSIEAYEQALILDPSDQVARENLQKALLEQKKNQPPPQQKNNKQKNQQQKKKPTPPSKLSKKQVEDLLKALLQKEKEVQQKMQQQRSLGVTQPDKDW